MNMHPLAAFLTQMGYRRTSRKHQLIARVDREDWLTVLAKDHFGNYNWAYNVGPDHYIGCYSKDRLHVPDWDVFIQIPGRQWDVNPSLSGYHELTENNMMRIKSLIGHGTLRRER